jgi:5-methylcytosine-specific restriction endonuclease McrA
LRANTICSVWRCPNLATDDKGHCADHRRVTSQEFRRRARTVVIRAEGRCELCGTPSTKLSAHHVTPLVQGGRELVDLDELLALCPHCQSVETPAHR